jgi:hypothetical protein
VPDAAVRRQLLSIHRAGEGLPNGVVNAPDALRRSTCLQKTAVLQGAFRRLTPQMSRVIGSEGQISAAFPSLDSGKTLRATTGDPLDFRATPAIFP